MRSALVKYNNIDAGELIENDNGEYEFFYYKSYVEKYPDQFITFNLEVRVKPYFSKQLFPFFDGLIPEGWLLNIAAKSWRIDKNDRMGLLLATGENCIGAVSVHRTTKLKDE